MKLITSSSVNANYKPLKLRFMKSFLKALELILILALGYYAGEEAAKKDNEVVIKTVTMEVQSEVATRYFDVIGNPSTQEEQCIFDKVIYGDDSECEL